MQNCSPQNVRFVCQGLDHPEGLCFTADGSLLAGSEAGLIYRIDTSGRHGRAKPFAQTEGFVLGLCADRKGNVYACDADRNEVLRADPSGAIQVVATGSLVNPNDCALDQYGNLFFTESGTYHPTDFSGRLFVVTGEGNLRCLHPGPLHFPNGIFVDSRESLLYVVESTGPRVVAYRLDGASLLDFDPVRRIPLAPGTIPDGIALDTDGNIYVAYYLPDQIGVIHPDGSLETLYRDMLGEWMNRPTNLVLRNNEIYFANLGGWHIGAVRHEATPLPPCMPAFGPRGA